MRMPNITPFVGKLAAVPDQGPFAVFSFLGKQEQAAVAAVSYAVAAGSRHKTNIGPMIDEAWSSQHQPITTHVTEGLAVLVGTFSEAVARANRASGATPTCFELGVCICGASGTRIWNARNLFYRLLKQVTPRKSQMRQHLKDGKLAVRLRFSPVFTFFASGDGISSDVDEDQFVFWHLSDISLSQCNVSFQRLPVRVPGSERDERIDVEASAM